VTFNVTEEGGKTFLAIARDRRPIHGWSLVELSVCICIVALLAVLIMPTVAALRAKANAAVCVSNLRSLGTAIREFGNDNNGQMPGPTYNAFSITGLLVQQIDPYLSGQPYLYGKYSKKWSCPANKQIRSNIYISYYANSAAPNWIFGYPSAPVTGDVLSPPRQIQVASLPAKDQWLLSDMDEWNYAAAAFKATPWPPFHGGGRNVLYHGGQVVWVKSVKNIRP